MNAPTVTVNRLTCAETAKLVRKALKDAFPGQKFSVRSSTYAGGASIHVDYTDGPSEQAVREVTDRFRRSDFDGQTDSTTYRDAALMANEDGTYEETRYGADFISPQREVSPDVRAALVAEIEAIVGHEVSGRESVGVNVDDDGSFTALRGSENFVQDLIYRASVRRAA